MSETAATRARLDERLNPILVKEVRQALRGRFFRILFGLTLLVTTFAGLLVVSAAARTHAASVGPEFFIAIYVGLSAAVLIFVPFWAYLSTSAEWDENTLDLLVLSNLGPRQIVWGKLSSALVQALLYYSTFTPFLVAAFLLNGLDLWVTATVLACSLASCIALCLIGIALAGLTHVRAVRAFVMALFGAGLTMVWGISISMVGNLVQEGQFLHSSEGQSAVLAFLVVVLLVGLMANMVAMARFAHDEENRSTPLRLVSLVLPLAATACAGWFHRQFSDHQVGWVMQLAAAHPLILVWVFFLTEPEALSRRTQRFAAERPRLALCASAFLPGGGRGVLLFLLHLALALGLTALQHLAWSAPAEELLESILIVAWFYGFSFFFLGLASAALAPRMKTPGARLFLRIALVLLLPLVVLVPFVLGLLSGNDALSEGETPLNPYWVIGELSDSTPPPSLAFGALGVLFLLPLLANLPRVLRALREPAQARRAHLARRARLAATSGSGEPA